MESFDSTKKSLYYLTNFITGYSGNTDNIRIKGSQEDIASESLTYILKKSASARQAINQIVELNAG